MTLVFESFFKESWSAILKMSKMRLNVETVYSLLFKLCFGLTTYVPTWPIEGFKGSNFRECRNEVVLVFIMFLLKEIKWKILNCFRRNIKSFFELKELCFLLFVYNHKNAKLFLTFSVLLLIRFAFSHLKFARLNKK